MLAVLAIAWDSPADAAFPGLNGKIVFVSNRDGDSDIYVMNSDGGNQTPLTINTALDGEPAWSPDGRQIAFVSDRDGNREIYKMAEDGSNQTRLTYNDARDRTPAWTADAAALSSSVVATAPRTRCAFPISTVSDRTATTIRDPA